MRPVSEDEISVNIPPFLSEEKLSAWLLQNEHHVLDMLRRPAPAAYPDTPPQNLWYRGKRLFLAGHDAAFVAHTEQAFLLPHGDWTSQQKLLRLYLHEHAAAMLLPRLLRHAGQTGLHPAAADLSDAKTFWGVCRRRTGIRLNWRLIGAPDFVADYVCIHELCHLRHADHSAAFWALVNRLTPHTAEAKAWLKRYGGELFALG